MKKVLLIDTSVAVFPVYECLIKRGYDVYVISSKENDCLSKISKNYIKGDYSDLKFLEKVIKQYKFDYIVPGGNDVSYLSAARISDNKNYFGIDPFDTTETINNKIKFRKFGAKINLHIPQIFSEKELDNINVPVIVKPVDSYSGRGITLVKDFKKESILKSIQTAINFSKSKSFVIEEYIEGQLYSHSAFICNQKIIHDDVVIEHCTTNPYTVDTSHVDYNFPVSILNKIREDIEKMSLKLKLVDGLIHTQFIKTKDLFRIVEVTRRCPGDLYSTLIEKSTGFQYADFYVKPFINERLDVSNIKKVKNNVFRHTISSDKTSTFIGIKYTKPVNMDLFVPLMLTGEELKPSPFGRMGIAFFKCKSKKDLKEMYETTLNRKLYQM